MARSIKFRAILKRVERMAKKIEIIENRSLKELTTFNIGGAAQYFTTIKTNNEAMEAIEFANQKKLPIFILGGGSNVLVNDDGFSGLVIYNKIKGIRSRPYNGFVMVNAGAGESWDDLVQYCVKNKWPGLECLSGIPGTVGASPIQNIGAYGQSLEDIIEEIATIKVTDKKEVVFSKNECKFDYRKSVFNTDGAEKYIITSVTFKLIENGLPKIIYQDLKNIFSAKTPTLSDIREAVLDIRNKKGMLVSDNPRYESLKSAGSFFKNPVIKADRFNSLKEKVRQDSSNKQWFWPQKSGEVKISAARLIQGSGFHPGYKSGNVGISPRHTLAIINLGNGRSDEIIKLAREIQDRVLDKFGIILRPEIQLVGFDNNPLLG